MYLISDMIFSAKSSSCEEPPNVLDFSKISRLALEGELSFFSNAFLSSSLLIVPPWSSSNSLKTYSISI